MSSLHRDQSPDATPGLGVSVFLQCTSLRVHAQLFRVLLLRLRNKGALRPFITRSCIFISGTVITTT